MILNHLSLEAKNFVASKNERYAGDHPLRYLKVDKDKVIASNGHALVTITHPNVKNSKEGEPVLLPEDAVKTFRSILGKKELLEVTSKKDKILVSGKGKDGREFSYEIEKPIVGVYPSIDKCFPSEVPIMSLTVSGSLFKRIFDFSKKIGDPSNPLKLVKLLLYGRKRAIRFEIETENENEQKIVGLAMPCVNEISGDEFNPETKQTDLIEEIAQGIDRGEIAQILFKACEPKIKEYNKTHADEESISTIEFCSDIYQKTMEDLNDLFEIIIDQKIHPSLHPDEEKFFAKVIKKTKKLQDEKLTIPTP